MPECFRTYIRCCKRCGKLYSTNGKFSKVCDDCKTPLGAWFREIQLQGGYKKC